MRTPFTGCGTALVTPFTASGALDEAAVRRLAKRQVDAGIHFLVPCGTTGEAPTLSGGRAAPRRGARGGRGGGPRAGARGRRRLRHARGDRGRARDAGGGRRGPPVGHALLQQADAGRPRPALPGDRRGDAAADRGLQRARPHGLQRRPRDAGAARDDPARRGGQGGLGQHDADLRGDARRAAPDFLVLSGDDALTLPAMAVGARGIVSVRSNELPAEMARLVEAAEAATSPRRASCTRGCCR